MGGRVQVEGGGGSGGGIVGGETWAVQGITTKNCGSVRSSSTFIALGVDHELFVRYEKARRTARKAKKLLGNLLRVLGLSSLKAEDVKKRIQLEPLRKNDIMQYVKKANDLAKVQDVNAKESESAYSEIIKASADVRLDVGDVAYARVRLRIGTTQTEIDEDRQGVCYFISSDEDHPAITFGALKPEKSSEES